MELNESSSSVAERIGTVLHPISSFIIIPIFALANAGVDLGGGVLGDAAGSAITWGVALGLVIGKTGGIFLMTWIAVRLPFTTRPKELNNMSLLGLSAAAGIGFTVALFITNLAYKDNLLFADESKIGILFASLVAGIIGVLFLHYGTKKHRNVKQESYR